MLRRQYAVSPANALRLNGAFLSAAMLAKLHKIVQWTKNENPSMERRGREGKAAYAERMYKIRRLKIERMFCIIVSNYRGEDCELYIYPLMQ